MKKYRLAIINSDPKEHSYGGVAPIMRNMHDFLNEHFDVEYFYLPEGRWQKLPLPGRLKVLIYIRSKKKTLKQFDFILSHIPEGSYAVAKNGVPFAHIYHGNTNPMVGSRYWFGKYFKKVFDKFDRVIEKKASIRYTVGPTWPGVKKMVNPICHDVKPLPIEMRRGFIFAGRLENGKNIDRIIHIYSQLTPEERAANPLTIAGTGTLKSSLEKIVETSGLDGEVLFTGLLNNSDLVTLDSTQRILLMASSHEGFPTAIAEALSVGVPVVTTDVGDIPSFIKDGYNGRMLPVDFKDDEYISAIRDILEHYDRYSAAAIETAKVFNASSITAAMSEEIIKVIEDGSKR